MRSRLGHGALFHKTTLQVKLRTLSIAASAIKLQDPTLLKTNAFIQKQEQTANTIQNTFRVLDPHDLTTIAHVQDCRKEDALMAIEAAAQALQKWSKRTAKDRSNILQRWAKLMKQHHKDLAMIMTREQGKPTPEAQGEIAYAASFVEWFAEEATRVNGQVLQSPIGGRRIMTLKQPVGVTAAITPWNFPSAMITRKAAAALAAGCTMVIKPSDLTPLSALALCELAERAGVPAGVLSVVPCSGEHAAEVGDALCESPSVRKMSFTGSTKVGKLLTRKCADTMKKVSMELGGNAPFLVFEDADIDLAVAGAMAAKFRNAGQTCVCVNRFYVHSKIHDEFVNRLRLEIEKLNVGNGLEPGVRVGPLINEAAVEKVEVHIKDALSKGANLVCGGSRHPLGGSHFQPTLVSHCDSSMRVFQEETFGPLAAIFRFESEDEAIRAANDSPYGLAAYFYSSDSNRAWRVAEALEYGMVGVNAGNISNEVMPFGGLKESGLGREGSDIGIDEYLEVKSVTFGLS